MFNFILSLTVVFSVTGNSVLKERHSDQLEIVYIEATISKKQALDFLDLVSLFSKSHKGIGSENIEVRPAHCTELQTGSCKRRERKK